MLNMQPVIRYNGALPMQSNVAVQAAGVAPNSDPLPPLVLSQNINAVPVAVDNNRNVQVAAIANVNQNALGQQFQVPSEFDVAVDTFNGKGWLASTIGDMKLFTGVCLKAFKQEGKRCGSAKVANKIGMKAPTIDKYLKFIMCLIKEKVTFSTIENLNQSLDDYSTKVLGYDSYAAVTNTKAGNGYSNMTTAQVERLLQ